MYVLREEWLGDSMDDECLETALRDPLNRPGYVADIVVLQTKRAYGRPDC